MRLNGGCGDSGGVLMCTSGRALRCLQNLLWPCSKLPMPSCCACCSLSGDYHRGQVLCLPSCRFSRLVVQPVRVNFILQHFLSSFCM